MLPAQGGLQPSHRLLITKLHLHREDNTRAFRAPVLSSRSFPEPSYIKMFQANCESSLHCYTKCNIMCNQLSVL